MASLEHLGQSWGTLWDTWVSIETSSGRLGTALEILRPPETPSQAEGSQVPRLRTKIEGGSQVGLLPGDLGQSRDIYIYIRNKDLGLGLGSGFGYYVQDSGECWRLRVPFNIIFVSNLSKLS